MSLYAESSAVLTWLLGQPQAGQVETQLRQSNLVASSDLTLVECERTLRRLVAAGTLTAVEAQARRSRLHSAILTWTLRGLDAEVLDRAKNDFPVEPIRALDALHLATAVILRRDIPDLALLSLDVRIRDNAPHLGFDAWP